MTVQALDPPRRHGLGAAAWIAAAALLTLYAVGFASPYGLRVLSLAGCQVLLVLGYQLIFGQAGALSLAQGAFFGLGAYVTALVGGRYGYGFAVTFPLSVLLPLTLAAIVAVPVLRLASHYFALATLGLAQVALLAVVNGPEILGGALGIPGVPGIEVLGAAVPRGLASAAAVWALVALGAWLAHRLTAGLTGTGFAMLRAEPLAAAAIGLDTARLRFGAFVLSAGYGGAAGALHAHTLGVVSSETLEFPVMVACLAMTVIGGSTRLAGAFIGALLLVELPEWLRGLEGYAVLAYGAALLAAIVLAPEGIAGLVASARMRWRPVTPPVLPAPRTSPLIRSRVEAAPVLTVQGLVKEYGGVEALAGVDLEIRAGEILGLIGPNGSGKTTLANLVSGFARADAGTIAIAGRRTDGFDPSAIARAGVGRSFQAPALPHDLTALDAVAVARAGIAGNIGFGAALGRRDSGPARQAAAAEALGFLERLGIADAAQRLCGTLGPNLARRVEIARALALDPRLLILDEPAAGLGEAEQAELGQRLRGFATEGMALLVIEHNMPFLLPIADRVAVLDAGRVIAAGRPSRIRSDPAVIAAYFGEAAP